MTLAVERPVWRRFLPSFVARAAEYVRSGGHAAVVHSDRRIDLLLPVDRRGELTELGEWSLLAIELSRWSRVRTGAARGLVGARVKADYAASVLDWCERDAEHPGPTRAIELDCIACAACCHDADVLLDDADLSRWQNAGRDDLTQKPNVIRSRDGHLRLRFLETGRCRHLRRDRCCAIYSVRPDNCRAFVVGSEACLSAREETLGLRDGCAATD